MRHLVRAITWQLFSVQVGVWAVSCSIESYWLTDVPGSCMHTLTFAQILSLNLPIWLWMEHGCCQIVHSQVDTEWRKERTYKFLTFSDRMMSAIPYGITQSWKKMYATCVNVIIAVSVDLMSLLYLTVIITTNWFPVLAFRNDPSTKMKTASSGKVGRKF